MKRQKGGILESKGLDTIMAVEEALSGTDICYFADYGTLLGIIRDNKLISWDDDIDYGILADDSFDWKGFEKQLSLFGFRKIKEFKYKETITEQTYQKGQLSVDFFSHKNNKEHCISHLYYRKDDFIYHSKYEYHVRVCKCHRINHTKQIFFEGIRVNVPENAEELLADIYTESWRIPDINWNTSKNDHYKPLSDDDLGEGFFFKLKTGKD